LRGYLQLEIIVRRYFIAVLFIVLVTGLIVPSRPATAQNENWEIRLNQFSLFEGPDTALLKLYFNIYDERSGTPMLTIEADTAEITLLNTAYTTRATLKKPDIPIYVTLVLDSSGSMAGAASSLQEAAKLTLNNMPADARFSIVQFDEEIRLLQDFTENISSLSYAIDQYSVSRLGTCLYDAAYTAVEALSKAPVGRRAVILFTDGKDETREGSQCSKHTYRELVDLANQNQVPVHTIGLSSPSGGMNEVELRSMAASTGGFSAIGGQDDLPASFDKIMQALKAQWMVEAPVYPRKGSNNAVFNLVLKSGQTVNKAFTFTSETEYPGPPNPVSLTFAGLTLNAAEQIYEAQVTLTSPDLVGYVKIAVWDTDAGIKVGEYVFENPVDYNSFMIPTRDMGIQRDFELRIMAVSRADQTPVILARDREGKATVELVHPFNFDPTSAYPSIQIQSVVPENGDLLLNVALSNAGLVGRVEGWLVNETTNTLVAGSNFESTGQEASSGAILIPMKANRIADGKYTVILRVLSNSSSEYSRAEYPGLIYKGPTLFARIGTALTASPIFLYAIIGIILVVVLFLMISSARQKNVSATPVAQGQLGKKLGSGKGTPGADAAVADHEPVPVRRAAPAPAAPRPTPVQTPPPAQPRKEAPPPAADTTMIDMNPLQAEAGATMIASTPPVPRASISVVRGPAQQGQTSILSFPFTLGRVDCDLTIADPNVSRRHAQLTFDAGRRAFFITDLNSSNGTFMNNQRLPSGEPVLIASSAEISLGPNVTIRITLL
jgi:VWFA-related protein